MDKAYSEKSLSRDEIIFLLSLNNVNEIAQIFELARKLKYRYFDNKVFLYGFVYFSTWCRNDCRFCYYRKSNTESQRYRKDLQEIVEASISLAESGVHLIDLTMGEDPYYQQTQNKLKYLVDLVRQVKKEVNLPIMISPGVVSNQVLHRLASAGADWYACYQETHNRLLFSELRLNQDYDERFFSKEYALRNGLLVEEGILTGVGESMADIADSIEGMRSLGAQQVRVMSFVPQKGSPMDSWQSPDRLRELKIISVLRLLFPDRLIPASLDIDGSQGLKARLNAGANVITSLIPSSSGLAGVAQSTKDIQEGYRTVQGILPILEDMSLEIATQNEYLGWIENERQKLSFHSIQKKGVQL